MDAFQPYANELLNQFDEFIERAGALVKNAVGDTLPTLNAATYDQLGVILMQQWLAGASCVLSLLIVLATIAAGWIALWHTALKEIGFFREIMGLNRPKPDVKAQRQASVKAEIERIKRQHSRPHSRGNLARPSNASREQQQAVPQHVT